MRIKRLEIKICGTVLQDTKRKPNGFERGVCRLYHQEDRGMCFVMTGVSCFSSETCFAFLSVNCLSDII